MLVQFLLLQSDHQHLLHSFSPKSVRPRASRHPSVYFPPPVPSEHSGHCKSGVKGRSCLQLAWKGTVCQERRAFTGGKPGRPELPQNSAWQLQVLSPLTQQSSRLSVAQLSLAQWGWEKIEERRNTRQNYRIRRFCAPNTFFCCVAQLSPQLVLSFACKRSCIYLCVTTDGRFLKL